MVIYVNIVDVSKKLLGLVAGEGGGNWGGCAPVRSSKFVISILFLKMRDEFLLSCSWDRVGIEGVSSQLNPNHPNYPNSIGKF